MNHRHRLSLQVQPAAPKLYLFIPSRHFAHLTARLIALFDIMGYHLLLFLLLPHRP